MPKKKLKDRTVGASLLFRKVHWIVVESQNDRERASPGWIQGLQDFARCSRGRRQKMADGRTAKLHGKAAR
jgi:hypothetical protein